MSATHWFIGLLIIAAEFFTLLRAILRPNREPAARLARHETACTLADAAAAASRLLKSGGRFCLCLRPERLCDAMDVLRRARLEPKRLRLVSKNAQSARKGALPRKSFQKLGAL